jgi:DNA-binding response OmpR family regulator
MSWHGRVFARDPKRVRAAMSTRLAFWGTGSEFGRLADYFEQQGYGVARIDGWAPGRFGDDVRLIVLEAARVDERILDICRRAAAGECPAVVVVIPGLGDGEAAVAALEAGAQEVLARPFNPREALARVRAVLRPRQARPPSRAGWAFGRWVLDAERRLLLAPEGDGVVLPPGEFELLRGFVDRPLCVLSRADLESLAPAEGQVDARVMDVRISRLRARFGAAGGRKVIETVRGEGYRFALPVQPLH